MLHALVHIMVLTSRELDSLVRVPGGGGGGGLLPYESLMGMCCWMGSHFHGCIDYNGVAFSIELLEWGHTFSDFSG